jgi:hypothetical protein
LAEEDGIGTTGIFVLIRHDCKGNNSAIRKDVVETSSGSESAVAPTVYWYGERGIVNAMISYISRPETIVESIKALLSEVCWGSGATPDWVGEIQNVALVVEVGLADFGDPDLLVVCYTSTGIKLVFVEAKVVSYTDSMQSTSTSAATRWGMFQVGFNSSINGQMTLKYRFAKALSRWDGVTPAIVEDEVIFRAYVEYLNDSPSKAPGRRLVKDKILKRIFKRLGLNGISEESCYFVALTWDARAKVFFKSKDVPSDCLPVFLDSNGTDVFAKSLQRIGWLGYAELDSALGLSGSPEYVSAIATMLETVEPSEAFYTEHRRGRWDSYPEWIVSLADAIASSLGSRSQRKDGSFSILDENGIAIAKIMPKVEGVFVGIRDGLLDAIPPENWQSTKSPLTKKKINTVSFSGHCVTTLAEASDFVVQLKGRVEGDAQPSEEVLGEEDAAL